MPMLFRITIEGFDNASEEKDFSYITDRTSGSHKRVIEHPAISNKHHAAYRFCHPGAPRSRIMNATFSEMKTTLNAWEPDGVVGGHAWNNLDFTPEEASDILQKSLVPDEDIRNMELIKASLKDNEEVLKVIIFDKASQVFLLRTIFPKAGRIGSKYQKPLKNPSQHPEWCVDLSTLLAPRMFWSELKDLINSM